jgi:hypothetical protein
VMDLKAAASYNNVVGASAWLRRAPEYTARRLWCDAGGGDVVLPEHGRGAFVPGAASPTSERYAKALQQCGSNHVG